MHAFHHVVTNLFTRIIYSSFAWGTCYAVVQLECALEQVQVGVFAKY